MSRGESASRGPVRASWCWCGPGVGGRTLGWRTRTDEGGALCKTHRWSISLRVAMPACCCLMGAERATVRAGRAARANILGRGSGEEGEGEEDEDVNGVQWSTQDGAHSERASLSEPASDPPASESRLAPCPPPQRPARLAHPHTHQPEDDGAPSQAGKLKHTMSPSVWHFGAVVRFARAQRAPHLLPSRQQSFCDATALSSRTPPPPPTTTTHPPPARPITLATPPSLHFTRTTQTQKASNQGPPLHPTDTPLSDLPSSKCGALTSHCDCDN